MTRVRSIGVTVAGLIVILAAACSSSSSPGGGGDGGGGGGGGGGPADPKTKDCGVHSTIGSCGPVSDNCYCSSTCNKFGTGSYQCVWTCSTDDDCQFNVKDPGGTKPWNGRCAEYNGFKYCQGQ